MNPTSQPLLLRFMRFASKHLLLGAVLLCTGPFIATAATTQPADPLVQKWIADLGSDDAEVRDIAEAHLGDSGKRALAPLRVALADPSPEVQLRARRAVRKIQLFLLPDVPDQDLAVAAAYLATNDFFKRNGQLNILFQLQPPPNAVLTRLIPLEPDEALRKQMLFELGIDYRDSVDRILTDENDPEELFTILNHSAEMWGGGAGEAPDEAMAAYLSGHLQEKIDLCKAEQINGDTDPRKRAASRLCFLYRMSEKYDLALQAARAASDPSLVFLVLQDQGDWATAAAERDDRWHDPMITTAYHAAFQRLAGRADQAQATMSAMFTSAAQDADDSFSPSKFFLLNDLPEDGISLLENRHPAVAFSMRLARGDIAGALDISAKYAHHPQDGNALALLRDDLRRTLGELPEPATMPGEATTQPTAERDWIEAATHLGQHKYQQAADEFGAMWEKDHSHYDRLYLQGYSLKAAGQTDRGDAMMQTAAMIPLGDPMRRWQLAGQLDAAGLPDVAEQQRNLALRSGCGFDEIGFSEIQNTRLMNALDHRQWAIASDALDRLCVINLSSQLQWHDPVRFLTVPATAHLVKARLAREHGDLSTAMRELAIYQQYLPIESDMVLEWTPALDALNEHDRADQLFNSVFEKLQAICQKYPKSMSYQNQLAWMSACCGRQLDAALTAAETAVKLKPGDWQLLDTLAEVHFRRGERPRAIETEKLAISIKQDPYLDRQLKRFESAPVPSTTQPGVAPE